jgi:hypothetical protein
MAPKWYKSWKSKYSDIKRGLNANVHIMIDVCGMPLNVFVSDKKLQNNQKTNELIQSFNVEYLISKHRGRGYN